jgi:hypothetical protein
MTWIFIALIAFGVYYSFRKKEAGKNVPEKQTISTEVSSKDKNFEDEINNLRNDIRRQKDAEIKPIKEETQRRIEAEKQAQEILNKEADNIGLRKSIAYLFEDMKHWHAWKDNSKSYFDELTKIQSYEFVNATKEGNAHPNYFTIKFNFNNQEYKILYDGRAQILRDSETLFEMELEYFSDEYSSNFIPKNVKILKKGEWVKAIILLEETIKAHSKKTLIKLGFPNY